MDLEEVETLFWFDGEVGEDCAQWLIQEVKRLTALCADYSAEVERVRKLLSEDVHIEKLVYENGVLDLNATHPMASAVTAALVSVFVSGGAENYFEMSVYHPNVGPMSVTLQKTIGKTPGQVAGELRAENERLQSDLTRANGETAGLQQVVAERDALSAYTPPFHYECGYIFDANQNMAADSSEESAIIRIRGWGRLQYMDNAAELQDTIGAHIAQALTDYWTAHVR